MRLHPFSLILGRACTELTSQAEPVPPPTAPISLEEGGTDNRYVLDGVFITEQMIAVAARHNREDTDESWAALYPGLTPHVRIAETAMFIAARRAELAESVADRALAGAARHA